MCTTALGTRRTGSTDVGWNLLTSGAAHLAGIQERLGVSYHDRVDEDGNLIAKRRHHPKHPRRTRPLRFTRDPEQSRPSGPGTCWVRPNAAARHLQTTIQAVTKLEADGFLTAQVVAGVPWFNMAELDLYLEDQKDAPKAVERVPLRKTQPRRLPKQSRRPPPGRRPAPGSPTG